MTVLSDIVDRLRDQAPIFQGRVSKARNLASPDVGVLPEAWVGRWVSDMSVLDSTIVMQRADRQIVVQIAVSPEYNDGDDDYYEEAKDEVLTALLGYEVGSPPWPLQIESETPVTIAENYALWRLIFTYTEYYREVTE